MADTTDSATVSRVELARMLPGYRLDPEPAVTTGMSQIYFATDEKLHHRKVAVKFMTGFLATHPAYRKRFLREIQLMASLEHPNVMHVLAAADDDDPLPYLVMPRVETDLRARLAKRRLTLAETAHVVTQTAAALDHAHDKGVVHRDVKPGNILFGKAEHVYLSDFGVARLELGEDLTKPGETIGTNRYTAPEVYGTRASGPTAPQDDTDSTKPNAPVEPRQRAGDVYSLGAVLYHCLTGKRPFDFADDSAAAAAQRRGELPPVSEVRPDLPPALDAVVSTAMDLDPARRYRSCGELAGALIDAVGLTGEESPLPVLREILGRLPAQSDKSADAATATAVATARRVAILSAATVLIALALLAGTLVYAFSTDAPAAADTGGASAASDEKSAASADKKPSESNIGTPQPVTGDERVQRFPLEGECIDDDPKNFFVVACDSDAAVEKVFKIAMNPKDPNPSQADHTEAAWEVCGGQDINFVHRWRDSASADGDREWNPETDEIHWIMCIHAV